MQSILPPSASATGTLPPSATTSTSHFKNLVEVGGAMGPLLKRYSCGSMLDKRSSADLEGVRTILPLDTLGRSHDAQNNHLSAHFARTRYRSSTAADFNRRSARTVE